MEYPEGYQPIDFLFAHKVFPNAPQQATLFLAYLLKSAREGHLCVALTPELDPTLLHGAELLAPSLFENILVQQANRFYLRRNWECEDRFLSHLQRIRSHPPSGEITLNNLAAYRLNSEQQDAIRKATRQSLTLISGGPGTGKTYTAALLIRLFLESGVKKIAVAAPTGKATANLRTALGPLAEKCLIKTLHALLNPSLQQGPLYADLILVDEGSMVDASLMTALFSAVRTGARLVLLGDRDQLPPVESGHFFADLARDPTLTAELTTCLRAELQEIVDLAGAVKRGEMIHAEPLPDVKALIQKIMQQPQQLLTPLRKGPYGVEQLNRLLYLEHQKRGAREIPILITVNDPLLNLYNGDMGVLIPEEQRAHFSEGRTFAEYMLPPYEHAYALSVHKSQGSEYDRVMIVLPEGAEVFGREMLYTALTRAKKEITLLAAPGILEKLLKTRSYRLSGV
ncbi:ATP-dependent RecD-like DNA helicase [Chlamydiota bacterium]